MKNSKIIALLTDFGLTDHYVACVKGSILSINPEANIQDVCHAIKPQAIREGAFLLREAYRVFPEGTIFVAVVDPGVGSSRKAICVQTSKGYLVGPDNGILSLALSEEPTYEIRLIQNDQFFRKPVSSTFHGRDIFGPVAAWLSQKDIFKEVGEKIETIKDLEISKPKLTGNFLIGEIVYIDQFGNSITNIKKESAKKLGKEISPSAQIEVASKHLSRLCVFFSEGQAKELISVWNSSGFLELAVPNGSAETEFKLKVGDEVKVL